MKKAAILVFLSIMLFQCAQVVTPTGGKKDETAPELLSSIPENKTVNFKESLISLTFDEYVVIDNLIQKLIITPETENTYTPVVKSQTVLLKFKKPFADSTTYTFNFSDGIKDLAERNPAQNLKLVFSTGPMIDSGRVYGTIRDIRTNKPVFDALVGLYKLSDTLNPEQIKPYYFSKTDSSGRFAIENTQIDNFSLIAISDKNRNLLYNPKEESIAFLDSTVKTTSDTSHYDIAMFHSDITPLRVQRTIPKVNDYSLVFNKGIDSLYVSFADNNKIPYLAETPTQIKFFNVPAQTDTVRASVFVRDSLGYTLEFDQKIAFLPQRGKERQTSPFSVKVNPEANQPIEPKFTLQLKFNKPVAVVNENLITITADSAIRINPEDVTKSWTPDSTQLLLNINTTAKDSLVVSLLKGVITSIEADSLAPTVYKYKILDPTDFGTIRGTVTNANDTPFFIELLDKDYKTVIQKTDKTPFTFTNIKPDTYRMRLILDDNKNGRWDTGDYKRKIQPEKIIVYPAELIIKANFEYDDQNFIIPR